MSPVLLNTAATALDLRQIASSGQCFRLEEFAEGRFLAVTGPHMVEIRCREGQCEFQCSPEAFRHIWVPYFDLDTDYNVFQARMRDDPFLRDALRYGGGIRILRQDLWETVVTFTISQRNNIPRIRRTVETLCRAFGSPLGELGGRTVYAFPTPKQLQGRDLSVASLGYRERYIRDLAERDEGIWRHLRDIDDTQARETLMAMPGIGQKVAECVLLFGLHRMDSYPKDVWIRRMIDDVYHGSFDPGKYAGYAGYVQQLQFYYYRNRGKEESAHAGPCDS